MVRTVKGKEHTTAVAEATGDELSRCMRQLRFVGNIFKGGWHRQ